MTSGLININKVLLILIDLLGLWVALWVFSAGPKKKSNQLFSLLTLSFLFWVNGGYVFSELQNPDYSLLLGRLILGEIFLFLIFLDLFSFYFPIKERKKLHISDKLIIVAGLTFFAIAILTNLVVKDVVFEAWGANPVFGKGSIIFYTAIFALTVLVIIRFLKKYYRLVKGEKLKAQYFLLGLIIFIGMNLVFNVFFPLWYGTIKYWQLGNYSAIFLLAFTAFAIVKRELFGIKVVLTGLLVGLITILLLLDALVFTENFTFRIIKMGVLLIFLYFGFLLINSVLQEIKRRQEIEKMSFKLEKAYQELKKLDVAKTEFISIASHQLRTPLTVIKGYISMMLEGSYGKMPIKTKGPMKNVYKSNERLIKLVNDMLTVSKVEMGKIEVEFKKTDIKNVISDLVNDLKLKVKEKNLYLNFEKPKKQLPKILIDADKIGQVILNILDNAIRYTDEGGITLKIEKLKTKVRIIISDTGSGMTKKEISRLFKSFTRGVAGTKLWTEGAGLGLYIAKKYIDLHKGKIWVESKGEGKGSTFFIELLIK